MYPAEGRLSSAVEISELPRNGRWCIASNAKEELRISTKLYAQNNSLQRKHNNTVLEFCQPAFLAEPLSTMQVLDVGCGTGDFTRDFLLPRCLPCARLVGIDCSVDMIKYASRHSAHEKIEYEVLDIGEDVTEFISHRGRFDRVYSFYCLQWLKDQGRALKNIAALMAPGGAVCTRISCFAPTRRSVEPSGQDGSLGKIFRDAAAVYSEESLHGGQDRTDAVHVHTTP
ncbi:hypothetical protein MRX96_027049 [Rhipicephalus microplus]